MKKNVINLILFVLLAVLWQYLMPEGNGIALAIAPLVIPAVTAGLSAISGLFSDSEEEKRNKQREAMKRAYLQQIQRNVERARKMQQESDSLYSGRIADRRGNLNAKLGEYGLDPVGSMYSNEKDLIDANLQNKTSIEGNMTDTNNSLQGNIDMLNAEMEVPESGISKFIGGGIKGFNLGSQISGAINPQGLGTNPEGIVDTVKSLPKKRIKVTRDMYGLTMPEEYSIP